MEEDVLEKLRILIADDHSMFREGLKKLFELEKDLEVIDEATNGKEALTKTQELKPDILLLDINMPSLGGLEVLRTIREKEIDVKVLLLTFHNEVEYLYKAVEGGADGYVLKDSESDLLMSAIRTISKGDTYIQPNMAALLFKKMNGETKEKVNLSKLSRREIEVLKLVTRGMLNKEIGIELQISEKTVKNHVSNIFKKIGVSDRTQAAVYAIKNDLVDIYQDRLV